MLLVALASTVIVLVTFVFTTLVDEPATAVLLARHPRARASDWTSPGSASATAASPSARRRRSTAERLPCPDSPSHHSSRSGSSSTGSPCSTGLHGRRSDGRARSSTSTGSASPAPTSSRRPPCLAARHRTYVPDLPGMGRSMRPRRPLDLPGLARALISYCDAVGVERATLVGNSLGCPIIVEVATSVPRPHRARRARLAGRRPEQPAARKGAAADGGRRVPRADVDGADRRPRLPALRRAPELGRCSRR